MQARRRGVRGYRLVTRGTRWGNPFPIPPHTREESLARYADWLEERLAGDPAFLEPLRGRDLGCTCPPHLPCHADLLLDALRRRAGDARR